MGYKNFKFDVDTDGIALVTWDMPGKSMNVIDQSVTDELSQIVDKVASDAAVKGAVVTSGKDTFSGGADLTMLQGLGKAFNDIAKAKGEKAAMQLFLTNRENFRSYFAGWKNPANHGLLRLTAPVWAALSSLRSRVIAASRRTIRSRVSAFRK